MLEGSALQVLLKVREFRAHELVQVVLEGSVPKLLQGVLKGSAKERLKAVLWAARLS